MIKMESKKNLSTPVKATIGFTVSNILQKGIAFLAVPIFTRLMSTQQYGQYSVFLSWLEIFEIITTFRIGWGGFVVGLNKYTDDREGYTSSLQCLSIIITTVFLFLYLIFHTFINSFTGMSTSLTLMMFAIMYFLPAMKFWTIRERVEYRYKAVLVVTAIMSTLIVAFGSFAAVVSTEKDVAVIFSRVVVQGILGIILIVYNCKGRFVIFNKEYWRRTLKFNVPLIPYYLSMVVLNSSDRIVIEQLVNGTAVAIYSVAYTASMCMQIVTNSINGVLQPWLYEHIRENNTKDASKIINVSLILVALLNLVLIVFAPEIMAILAPNKYSSAIWVMPPLAASVTVMFFYQHFVNIEFYFEESKLTSIASIGAAVLNLVLNYIFIPIFGYLAAGYTTLASYLIFGISHYFFMNAVCKKNNYKEKIVDIKSMLVILIAFFVVTAILLIGYNLNFIRYAFIIVVMIIAFYKKDIIIKFIKNKGI